MDDDAYRAYRSVIESPTLRSIWADVYGERFWPDVEPPWTLSTIDDVHFVTERLRLGPGARVVDLGCGSGCLVRHVVRTTGAHVTGIDANPIAVRSARERSGEGRYSGKVDFVAGDICATGFPDRSFDAAASLDVLLFTPDKHAAIRETFRILKPGARFAGTTFELRTASPSLGVAAFEDYPAAFEAAGFAVEIYEETDSWRQLIEGVTSAILAREADVNRELAPQSFARVRNWARTRPAELGDSRRVRFCVRRPD